MGNSLCLLVKSVVIYKIGECQVKSFHLHVFVFICIIIKMHIKVHIIYNAYLDNYMHFNACLKDILNFSSSRRFNLVEKWVSEHSIVLFLLNSPSRNSVKINTVMRYLLIYFIIDTFSYPYFPDKTLEDAYDQTLKKVICG